jgi:hypothetical protein
MEPWTFDHIHERPKKDDPHRPARAIVAVALAWGFVLTTTVGTAYSGLRFGKRIACKVKRKVRG